MTIMMDWEEYESNVPVKCEVCGWEGRSKEAELRMPDETVSELICPQCRDYDIAYIDNTLSPTEIERRAAAGDQWCGMILETQRRIEETLLKGPDQLPDIEGHSDLYFIWDAEGSEEEGVWTVIRLKEGEVIWREQAYYRGIERFAEVEGILKKKYGERFRSMEVNFGNYLCGLYYYGD